MCFKKMPILILSVLLLLPACAKEEADYYDVPVVSLKGASCFSNISSQLEKYFEGDAKERDVDAVWNCARRSFTAFSNYVEGEEKGVYKATDLRVFLEKYFLNTKEDIKRGKNRRISDGLLEEAMEIKRLFLGGQRGTLTKLELEQTLTLIEEFRRISKEFLPYTRLLFKESDQIPPAHQHRDAERALEKAFRQLMSLIAKTEAEYELNRLETLFTELAELFKVDNPDTTIGDVVKYLPALFEFKGILLNSNRLRIESHEWEHVGSVAGRLFSLITRAKAYFSEKSLLDGDQLEGMYSIFVDSLSILRGSLERRQFTPIPNVEVNSLIDELAQADLLPFGFDADSAKKIWLRVSDHILNPQNTNPASGISPEKIAYLESELKIWFKIQNALVFEEDLTSSADLLEMKDVLDTPWPIRLDINGRVLIDGNKNSPVNIESSTRLNWARALFKILFKAYIKDAKRRDERKMSTEELRSAFLDIKEILVAMDLIEKDNNDFDGRLFRDANLFMPRSDGDEYLSFYETIEYLHFIYAGIDAGAMLIEGLLDSCRVDEERVKVECFREVFQGEYKQLLEHLPLFVRYADKLSDKDWKKDIKALEKVNRDEGASSQPMFTSDIYETFIALQYIETLFLRFDADQSGKLNIKEVLKALKHFRNVLKDLFGLKTDEEFAEMEAVFTYLFKYGSFPDPTDPLSDSRFNNWKWNKDKWELGADRGIVLQILAAISGI